MKFFQTTLLTLVCFSFYFSQKITLNWEQAKKIDNGSNDTPTLPFFSNRGYSTENGIPTYFYTTKVENKELIPKNMQWERINIKDLFDTNIVNIPENNIPTTNYYFDKDENSYMASLRIVTLKKERNQYFRLISFDLMDGNFISEKLNKKRNQIGTTENPLKQGNFYKIKVDKSGVFKITAKFLRDNGINPSDINPKNFRIYGNGGIMLPEVNTDNRYAALQENAIEVIGENDGKWDDGDFAIFFAQGPNGFNIYSSGNGNGYKRTENRMDPLLSLNNIYEDYSYYFINFDKGPGKRIQVKDADLPAELITRYDDYQVLNAQKNNLLKIGRIWVDDYFSTSKTITFTTKSPIQENDIIRYRTNIVGYKNYNNKVTIKFNNEPTGTPFTNDNKTDFVSFKKYGQSTNLSGNEIKLEYIPDFAANPNGLVYFDYAEVQYKENLAFNDSQLIFRDYGITEGFNDLYGFSITNAAGIEKVWDVSDITNVTQKINKSGNTSLFNFGYLAESLYFNNEFVAFKTSATFNPSFVGKIPNQDIAALQNIDYLILTQPEFLAQAERLANYHRTTNNYNVAVVDVNQIYNEYSSGSQDITATRDFITKLNTPSGSLKYVFILGDTSFDFKNKYGTNGIVVPSYESESSGNFSDSFVTDDYYVMTAPQYTSDLGAILPNLPIGRLPAQNTTEAKLLIDKTLAYYNNLPGQSSPFGDWRMKLHFVVDDDGMGQGEGGIPFHFDMESALKSVFETNTDKPEYNVKKLYLDSFPALTTAGGQRYPQINQAITNATGNSLYLFYFGHGGINGWAQERVLTNSEVSGFSNFSPIYSHFPLISTITCEFTLWDDPGVYSLGEQTIKNKNGGATAMITSSRALGVDYGKSMTSIFTKNVFKLYNDDFLTLGDAFLKSRQEYFANPNHLKVNLLGDPAIKLSRPKKLLIIDQITSPIPNQLRALDFVKITGHINKADGNLDSSFNGKVSVNVFDKRLTKKTLNNDGNLLPIMTYTEEGSPIVKSSGLAKNGLFTVEFYVPKDINYDIGTGRILVYADNNVYDVFNNQTIKIGGINETGINDNQPPKLKLFMNNTNFANGGITNVNPILLACVTDDTGINSTGSGIGHDITTYLDGQIINTLVLNDFFNSGEGSGCVNASLAEYQKGYITYPFRNLSPGAHTLTFKVWDINNNSTTETLNFVVRDESTENLVVTKLLNWPNPFTDKTYIQFEHNCDDILDVNVQIFTITGKLVRTISTPVSSVPFLEGYRTDKQAIEWDGKDDFGDAVGKGTYIYKVFVRSQNQDKCKGSTTQVEKLVILK